FLIYLPVYRRHTDPTTVAERRATLAGFVYSPFRAGDLLQAIFGKQEHRLVDFDVYDGQVATPEHLLHRSSQSPSGAERVSSPRFARIRHLVIRGRDWTLAFTTRPEFEWDSQQRL